MTHLDVPRYAMRHVLSLLHPRLSYTLSLLRKAELADAVRVRDILGVARRRSRPDVTVFNTVLSLSFPSTRKWFKLSKVPIGHSCTLNMLTSLSTVNATSVNLSRDRDCLRCSLE